MVTIFNGRSRTASASKDTSFIQVEHKMLKHLKLFTGNEWLVFTSLALHIDDEGRCFPSMARIMHVTGLSAPTIRTAMKGLQSKMIDECPVLAVNERFAEGNRQTSNEFILFPGYQGEKPVEGEGKDICTGEGANLLDPFNKSKKEQDSSLQKRTRGRVQKMPKEDDPARILYEAYRLWLFPSRIASDFTLGEWQSVNHVLRQLCHRDVDERILIDACENLRSRWGNKEMVTLNALWKHWTTATTPVTQVVSTNTTTSAAQNARNIMDAINRNPQP